MGENNTSQNKQDRSTWRKSTMEISAEAALLFMWVSHGLTLEHLGTKAHTHTAVCPLPHQQDGEKIRKVIIRKLVVETKTV